MNPDDPLPMKIESLRTGALVAEAIMKPQISRLLIGEASRLRDSGGPAYAQQPSSRHLEVLWTSMNELLP
jgi:hypothetical protein